MRCSWLGACWWWIWSVQFSELSQNSSPRFPALHSSEGNYCEPCAAFCTRSGRCKWSHSIWAFLGSEGWAPSATGHDLFSSVLTWFMLGALLPQLLQLLPDLLGQNLQRFPQVSRSSLRTTGASCAEHPAMETKSQEAVKDQCRLQYILMVPFPIPFSPRPPTLLPFFLPNHQPCRLQPPGSHIESSVSWWLGH